MSSSEGEHQIASGGSWLIEDIQGTVRYARKEKNSTKRRGDGEETKAVAQNTLRVKPKRNSTKEAMKTMAKVLG